MSLADKLKKLNTIKNADLVSNSKFFVEKFHDSGIPILNVAFSAKLDGGFPSGCHIFAGDSKTFKTMFALYSAKQFVDSNPDAMVVFYDCEFGFSEDSAESVGLDPTKVHHKPIESIEDLTHDMTVLLKGLDKDDNVMIIVDSYGEVASAKEVNDAEEGKNVTDMTRAKALNSHFRIIRPLLRISETVLIGIGAVYDTQAFYSTKVLAGGRGITKQSDSIFLISKSRGEMDGKEIKSNSFNLTVNKGRLVKENSKVSVIVSYEDGIDKYSGIFDLALETGHIAKESAMTYKILCADITGRRKAIETPENMKKLVEDQSFKDAVHKKFSLGILEQTDKTTEE